MRGGRDIYLSSFAQKEGRRVKKSHHSWRNTLIQALGLKNNLKRGLASCGACKNDAGPGERVPGEPPSHGRDSANVSGHTIPAMLCGNQYAVLFDTEPTENEIVHGGKDSHNFWNIRFTRIVRLWLFYGFPF